MLPALPHNFLFLLALWLLALGAWALVSLISSRRPPAVATEMLHIAAMGTLTFILILILKGVG